MGLEKSGFVGYTHKIVNDPTALTFLRHRNVLKFRNVRIGKAS